MFVCVGGKVGDMGARGGWDGMGLRLRLKRVGLGMD